MNLSWEQKKRFFILSSSVARDHPMIIHFCLSVAAKLPTIL